MAAGFFVGTFLISWLFAGQTSGSGPGGVDTARPYLFGIGASMGYIFPVIVGALAVTAEYRYSTIVPTFLGEPRRWVAMVAKVVAAVPMGFLIGVVGTVACIAGTGLGFIVGGGAAGIFTLDTLTLAGLSVLTHTVWALVGVGLGMLVTSQVGVIIAVLAFTQLVEPVLRVGMSVFSATQGIPKFLPGAAADALAGGHSVYAALSTGVTDQLTIWQGGLVLAAYGVAFGVLGYFLRIRRNVA
jgi:hypothetical protein